jgi:hypothetical protein
MALRAACGGLTNHWLNNRFWGFAALVRDHGRFVWLIYLTRTRRKLQIHTSAV